MSLVIQILRQVFRKWYLLVFVPIVAASLVIYLTGKSEKKFESNATLYMNLPTNNGLSITNEGYKQHEISAYIQDLIQLTRSNKSMELVRLFVLKDYLEGKNDLFEAEKEEFPWTDSLVVANRIDTLIQSDRMMNVRDSLDATMNAFLANNEMTNSALKDMMRVYREGSSNYLRLKVTTSDPFKSAYFGNKITDAMLILNKSINQGKVIADQQIFEKLVAQAKEELDKKVANLERYKIRYNVINLPEHTKAIVNQMVQLEVQRASLLETLASKEEGILQLKKKLGVVDEIPVDLSKNARFIELQNKIRSMRSSASLDSMNENSALNDVQNTTEEIDQLFSEYVSDVPIDIRKTRQELIQLYLSYQVEVEMTKEMIPVVEAELQRIKAYSRKFAPLESNIGTLEREITTAQETYLILVNKLNLAKTVAQAAGVNELVLVDSPDVPMNPLPSKRKILVILSGMLTFLLVVFLIAAIEFLDAGIWSARDYELAFGHEPAVVVPSLFEFNPTFDTELKDFMKVIFGQKLKSLAFKLDAMSNGKSRKVVILSALPGEGKKLLASKLTHELNQLGYTVSASEVQISGYEKELISPLNRDSESHFDIQIIPPFSVYAEWERSLQDDAIYLSLVHAGRASLKADKDVFARIPIESHIRILNNVHNDYLEESGSNVIKRRSIIRIWVKRILTLQFKTKSMELSS